MTPREVEIRQCEDLLDRTRKARAKHVPQLIAYYDAEIKRLEEYLAKLKNRG